MENKQNFLALAQLIDFNSTEIDKSLRAIFEKAVSISREKNTYLVVGNNVCIKVEFHLFDYVCSIVATHYFHEANASESKTPGKLFSMDSLPIKALAFDKLQSKLNSFLEIGEEFDWESDDDTFLKEITAFVNKA